MLLFDANILVYAHRVDSPDHDAYREWLEEIVNGESFYGISDLVIGRFLRIVTHSRVFNPPSRMADALIFANQLLDQPNAVNVSPGPRHWSIFERLCREAGVKGDLVPDAYLAALAIETGSEWISTDRDFSRFPGLQWRHPFDRKTG